MRSRFARYLPLLFPCLTIFLPACRPKTEAPAAQPQLTESQVRRLIREEVAATLLDKGAVSANTHQIQQEIDELVLARVKEELAKSDASKLAGKEITDALKAARPVPSDPSELKRVDLTGIPTMEGKVRRLLEEFKGLSSYTSENEVVKQLIELGPEAKPALLQAIRDSHNGNASWSATYAMRDAVKPLLTSDDKDFLVEDLTSGSPMLTDYVISTHMEGIGPVALKKLGEYVDDPESVISGPLLQVVLEFNEEEAIPLLQKRLASGSQDAVFLAGQLDQYFPAMEMNEQLKVAAAKIQDPSDRFNLAELMLKRGLPESLPLLQEAISTPDTDSISANAREDLYKKLRQYTRATGANDEVAQWLRTHGNNLRWNAQAQVFEEAPSP